MIEYVDSFYVDNLLKNTILSPVDKSLFPMVLINRNF